MSVNIKQADNTLKKIAGNTILLDATCSEIRSGTFSIQCQGDSGANAAITFETPMSDTDYVVIFESDSPAPGEIGFRNKTTTGFGLYVLGGRGDTTTYTFTGKYYAFRLVELEGYNAIYNKMTNIDTSPTDNSTNLVTSGGVYDAIKNASSVFIGTSSEWESESAKTDYQVAILTDKPTVNAVDSTDGSTTVVANKHLVFTGDLSEWNSLSISERKAFDEALISNDMDTGEVVNAVTDGDMRAVTSNAVYDALANVSEVKTASIEKTTVAGITTYWSDNVGSAHTAYRNGKQVVMNIAMGVTGTFTGAAGWQKLFELPTSLLEPGESFAIPYMVSVNDGVDSTLLNGNLMYFDNGQTVNFRVMAQVILFVV